MHIRDKIFYAYYVFPLTPGIWALAFPWDENE